MGTQGNGVKAIEQEVTKSGGTKEHLNSIGHGLDKFEIKVDL